jgi:hypothetical protein
MIKMIIFLLESVPHRSKAIDRAMGRYKYPRNWFEFKRYLKYKFNSR